MPVDRINRETLIDIPCGHTTFPFLPDPPYRRKERRRGDVVPDPLERNPVTCLLEAQLQAQQHLPSPAGPVDWVAVTRLPARLAEPARAVHGSARRRIAEAVEDVEGRDAALQGKPLVDLHRLTYRQIQLMECRADQCARLHVAESSLSRRNDHRAALHIAPKFGKRKQTTG